MRIDSRTPIPLRASPRLTPVLAAVWIGLGWIASPAGSASAQEPPRTRLVLLGTGTPNADPERSGPATTVVVDGRAYLFDAGSGVVRRAAQAARDRQIPALLPPNLELVFRTHLHSDHTVGLPDLLLGPWVLGRREPLSVLGPRGTGRMMDGILAAWSADIGIRLDGLEPRGQDADAYRAVTREIGPGLAYEDDLVRVTALAVSHGSIEHAFGYRIEAPDRTIVISGDATPSSAIVDACDGCDILLHEVFSAERLATRPAEWRAYHTAFHTSTVQLADIANRARPGLLVSGRDLDVY